MHAHTDSIATQFHRLRAQAIAQRLSGPLESWSAELQALENTLDRLSPSPGTDSQLRATAPLALICL